MSDHNANKKDSPMQAMWMSLTGASAHLHEEVPGISGKSQQVGHEPDEFGLRAIVYVPIAVIVTLILTYITVSSIFTYIIGRGELVAETKPFNDRAARISSDNPKPLDANLPAVPQPRLEGIQQVNAERNGVLDPSFLRSFRAADGDKNNNPPEIYPEFLRAENFVDLTSHKRALHDYDWVDQGKHIVQVPIDDAMTMLIDNKTLKAKAGAATPGIGSLGKAKLSTGGRGGPSEPKEPKPHTHTHDH